MKKGKEKKRKEKMNYKRSKSVVAVDPQQLVFCVGRRLTKGEFEMMSTAAAAAAGIIEKEAN